MIKDQRISLAIVLILIAILATQLKVVDAQHAAGLVLSLLTWLVGLVTKGPGDQDQGK